MKLFIRPIICILLSFFAISFCGAQDIIIKKDGEKVKAKIVEINDTQIKYYEFRDINNLLFTIDRALIKEIRFETGTKYKEERPGSSDLYYLEDRINALKINFFTLGEGNLILTYEKSLDPGSSLETTLKIYGIGDSDFENNSGAALNFGYKFKLGSIFKKSNEYRPKHILHGGYFRPVLGYSYNKITFSEISNRLTEKDSYVHFGLDLGKQWIVRNSIAFDIYIGFHYYGGSFTTNDPNADVFRRANDIFDGDLNGTSNRAVAFGFRVGGLFGKKGLSDDKTRSRK